MYVADVKDDDTDRDPEYDIETESDDTDRDPEYNMETESDDTDAKDFRREINNQDKSLTDDEDEIRLHLLDEISVYMTTPTGGAPYLCPNCDYKTTIDVIYDNHRQSHTDYAVSDW